MGGHQLLEHIGREEGIDVKGIVGAQGKAVQQAGSGKGLGLFGGFFQPAILLVVEAVRVLIHLDGHFHHVIAGGNGNGGVAVHHQEILIAAHFPDDFQQTAGVFQITGVGMDKNGVVVIALGGLDVQICHVVQL